MKIKVKFYFYTMFIQRQTLIFKTQVYHQKAGGIQSSDFQELLDRIGVSIDSSKVLLDRKYAIPVTSANSDRPIKHAAILSFPKSSF